MALTKGSKRLFDWLKNQQAGTIVHVRGRHVRRGMERCIFVDLSQEK